jgi:hypothetical protein
MFLATQPAKCPQICSIQKNSGHRNRRESPNGDRLRPKSCVQKTGNCLNILALGIRRRKNAGKTRNPAPLNAILRAIE